MYLDLRNFPGTNVEAIGSGNAFAVEQRIDGKATLLGRGANQPEIGEAGEFFALGRRRIDGKAPRRYTEGLVTSQQAKIGRPQKNDQLIFVDRSMHRKMHAKPGKPKIGGKGRRDPGFAKIKLGIC